MGSEMTAFITPVTAWNSVKDISGPAVVPSADKESALFKDVFDNAVNQVYSTQKDVERKQYLLATGQLDDAHSLPIAEAKASLSLDVLISLRNKTMESYNELIKMNL